MTFVSSSHPSGQNPQKRASSSRKFFSKAAGWTALAGGIGGLVGDQVAASILSPFFDFSLFSQMSIEKMLLGQSLGSMFIGVVISSLVLIADNHQSLRGKWNRDLGRGLPFFLLIGLCSGGLAQLAMFFIGHTRSLPWAIMGAGIGGGIGWLRRDKVQTQRGAIGGAIGGFISGLMIDALLAYSYTDTAFAWGGFLGVIITGALIGLFMRMVQEAMQSSWLLGVSSGPYMGKQYPLNGSRVTVGKSELCDIALYRKSELPVQQGAFVLAGTQWTWQGEAVEVNGVPQSQVLLSDGDTLRFGNTMFQFMRRQAAEVVASSSPASAMPVFSSVPASPPPFVPVLAPDTARVQPLPPAPTPIIAPPSPPVTPPVQWLLAGGGLSYALPSAPARASIGRREDNTIVLPDASVSSAHAVIEVRADSLVLSDLNSTNGTSLNGHKIAPGAAVLLREGDHLQMGEGEYTVQRRA